MSLPAYDHMLVACPKCGSIRYIHGSPNGIYVPGKSFVPLYRVDWCLDCKHEWVVNYPKKVD